MPPTERSLRAVATPVSSRLSSAGFALGAAQQAAVREPLRVGFRLRDEAVHPPAAWTAPATHPTFNLAMEPRFVNYRAETRATRNCSRKLIWVCMRSSRQQHEDLAACCEATKNLVAEPRLRRAGLPSRHPGCLACHLPSGHPPWSKLRRESGVLCAPDRILSPADHQLD